MTRRYEDVDGPGGDDPQSLDVFGPDRDWLDDRPTKADTDADAWELRSMRTGYSDGGI